MHTRAAETQILQHQEVCPWAQDVSLRDGSIFFIGIHPIDTKINTLGIFLPTPI